MNERAKGRTRPLKFIRTCSKRSSKICFVVCALQHDLQSEHKVSQSLREQIQGEDFSPPRRYVHARRSSAVAQLDSQCGGWTSQDYAIDWARGVGATAAVN